MEHTRVLDRSKTEKCTRFACNRSDKSARAFDIRSLLAGFFSPSPRRRSESVDSGDIDAVNYRRSTLASTRYRGGEASISPGDFFQRVRYRG